MNKSLRVSSDPNAFPYSDFSQSHLLLFVLTSEVLICLGAQCRFGEQGVMATNTGREIAHSDKKKKKGTKTTAE